MGKNLLTHCLWLWLWLLLLPTATLELHAQQRSQDIRLDVQREPLPSVLRRLEKTTYYKFLFTNDDLKAYKVSCKLETTDINEAMRTLLKNLPLSYNVKGKYVYVVKKQADARRDATSQASRNTFFIKGCVKDKEGSPLPGANIRVEELNGGTTTRPDGTFIIELQAGTKATLTFSFIGTQSVTRVYDGSRDFNDEQIVLEEDLAQIDEVVVTGMFTRRAESFTGSAVTYKKEQLLESGNQNLLKSLKNLDPSFQIVENLDMGSDPNHTPEIQVRGATSFNLKGDYEGNPNQPLFILDGFETNIEKMYDLDMNRVQSVTILKDAAAKAIYGSKAGNGVIVVETVRPKSGELKVYYTGDLNIEAPDLTGYNLMNAQEKLDFEVERGMYDNAFNLTDLQELQDRLKLYRDNIARGVDTYWLSQPLRTGIGQKHSLTLEGGDDRMRYQAGVSYNDVKGIMKGSGRNTLNLNTTLSYSYKTLIFRNTLEYTQNWSANSPYGSFSEYVGLNPYWKAYEDNGQPVKVLGVGESGTKVYNPLYNASLNTKNTNKYAEFRDNFGMEWHISKQLRATANFSYTHRRGESDLFYPSSHTMFAEYDNNGLTDRKGRYTKGNSTYQSLTGNAGINFNRTLGHHLIFANATWNMQVTQSTSDSYTAEGFGNDQMDNIGFATQYLKNSAPTASDNETRELGLIGAVNYSYADRYLFDASIRYTGSSIYGSDNRWGAFWSLGLGWNLHHEPFLKDNPWIRQLKLRMSTGYTGTQNFNPYQARARYRYSDIIYNGRYGALLQGLPNNALRWQKVLDSNYGFDLTLKQFLNVRFDYYTQKTTNMLSDITTALSTGFTTYKANLGEIKNKGYDLTLSLTPWRDNKQRGWLTFTFSALHNENKIVKIYDLFKSYNTLQNSGKEENINTGSSAPTAPEIEADRNNKTKPSTLYYEGCSMTAIWGVPSLGIDPMTGRRIYVDKNGNPTYNWNVEDQRIIGDTAPKLQGTIGLSGGWRGLTWGISCSYRLGGDFYNSTLVNKVENVTGWNNLDRRIYDSWRNVGDIAPYKELAVSNSYSMDYTKPNSCFVQKNNELYCNSINVGYELGELPFIKNAGFVDRLKLTFYMNELFRLSSVKVERGTDYPFARTFSLSLQATF